MSTPSYDSALTTFFVSLFVGILVVQIGFALMAAVAASARGHRGCLWPLVTFFLGPLSLLAMLLFPVNQEVLDARKVKLNQLKWCQYCRRGIHIEATKCCYCQVWVDSTKQENQNSSKEREKNDESLVV